jgi:hypothetical protein
VHWAPIPIAEFIVPTPPSDFDVAEASVYRLLSRAPRRGFWLSAVAFIALLALATIGCFGGYVFGGLLSCVLCVVAGTAHLLTRHKLNVALWITREPAAVYWAEPGQPAQQPIWSRKTANLLTLHTPAPVRLEALLSHAEMITVLQWLRQRNPAVLVGSFSPNDSDGRLTGNDPWSSPSAAVSSGAKKKAEQTSAGDSSARADAGRGAPQQ